MDHSVFHVFLGGERTAYTYCSATDDKIPEVTACLLFGSCDGNIQHQLFV
jgi:hypothetical protein